MKSHNGYSELQVLESAAGFYIGRTYTDETGFVQPGGRDSVEYYPSAWQAEFALTNNTYTKRGYP